MHGSFSFSQMHPLWQFHYPCHLKAMCFLKPAFSKSEAKCDHGKVLFKQTLVNCFLLITTLSSMPNNSIFQFPGLPSLALTGA